MPTSVICFSFQRLYTVIAQRLQAFPNRLDGWPTVPSSVQSEKAAYSWSLSLLCSGL